MRTGHDVLCSFQTFFPRQHCTLLTAAAVLRGVTSRRGSWFVVGCGDWANTRHEGQQDLTVAAVPWSLPALATMRHWVPSEVDMHGTAPRRVQAHGLLSHGSSCVITN